MQSLITIFREVRDPRDFNARHDLAAMLFIALAATLCGAKTCVDIADFAAANEAELSQIVDLPHGAPSHDSFSRLFRLLDPEEMAEAFARFKDGDARRARTSFGQRRRRRRRQEPAPRLRARPRLHAPAHDQRLGRRDAAVPGEPPCAGRRRSGGDLGGVEKRDPERLHRQRPTLCIATRAWPKKVRARGSSLRLEAEGQPRAALRLCVEGFRGGRRWRQAPFL